MLRSDIMGIIRKIEPPVAQKKSKKRITAYSCVSRDTGTCCIPSPTRLAITALGSERTWSR